MITNTDYKHVYLDDKGVAIIAGTTMKVSELVTSHCTHGWSPEELHFQFPHIALGQIYSALAYYWDHQSELDAEIQQRLERVDYLRQLSPPSRMSQKLREQGLIS